MATQPKPNIKINLLKSNNALLARSARRAAAYALLGLSSTIAFATQRPIIIIATPFGNLGNRLFLYANIISFAIEHKAIVINPAFHPWRKLFNGTKAGAVACFPKPELPHLSWDGIELFIQQIAWACESIAQSKLSSPRWASIRINNSKETASEMVDLSNPSFISWAKRKHVIFLSGYLFLAETLMRKHAKEIALYFSQLEGNSPKALEPVQKLREENDLIIGVVIRHGGYKSWLNGKYYFPTTTYINWIKEAAQLHPNLRTGFFLCSDCEQDLTGLEGISYSFRWGSDLENRAALMRCDMLISPPSSYSGWAAFMGKIPLLILASQSQQISREAFKTINNHTDLRDDSYPANIDNTDLYTSPSGKSVDL